MNYFKMFKKKLQLAGHNPSDFKSDFAILNRVRAAIIFPENAPHPNDYFLLRTYFEYTT